MTHISMKRVAYLGSWRLNQSREMTSATPFVPSISVLMVTPLKVGSSPLSSLMLHTTLVGTRTCVRMRGCQASHGQLLCSAAGSLLLSSLMLQSKQVGAHPCAHRGPVRAAMGGCGML